MWEPRVWRPGPLSNSRRWEFGDEKLLMGGLDSHCISVEYVFIICEGCHCQARQLNLLRSIKRQYLAPKTRSQTCEKRSSADPQQLSTKQCHRLINATQTIDPFPQWRLGLNVTDANHVKPWLEFPIHHLSCPSPRISLRRSQAVPPLSAAVQPWTFFLYRGVYMCEVLCRREIGMSPVSHMPLQSME